MFVFCEEPFHANSNQRFSPTTVENLIAITHATVSLKEGLCIVDLLFVKGQKILSAATLKRSFTVGSVYEEMHGVPAASHETVKWRPIRSAKLLKRSLRHFRLSHAACCGENYAPLR